MTAFQIERIQYKHLIDRVNPVWESLGQTLRVCLASLPCCVLLSLIIILTTGEVRSGEFQAVTFGCVFTTAVTSHVRSASLAPHLDSICVISRHAFTEDILLNVCEGKRRCIFVHSVDECDRGTRNLCELLQKLTANEFATLLYSISKVGFGCREHLWGRNGGCIDAFNTRSQRMWIDISRLSKQDTIEDFQLADRDSG